MMDHTELVTRVRLERERAQKAQFTAMLLRACALQTRERYRMLRDDSRGPREADFAWAADLSL